MGALVMVFEKALIRLHICNVFYLVSIYRRGFTCYITITFLDFQYDVIFWNEKLLGWPSRPFKTTNILITFTPYLNLQIIFFRSNPEKLDVFPNYLWPYLAHFGYPAFFGVCIALKIILKRKCH